MSTKCGARFFTSWTKYRIWNATSSSITSKENVFRVSRSTALLTVTVTRYQINSPKNNSHVRLGVAQDAVLQ
jgi:hypothetical protein